MRVYPGSIQPAACFSPLHNNPSSTTLGLQKEYNTEYINFTEQNLIPRKHTCGRRFGIYQELTLGNLGQQTRHPTEAST